MDKNTTPRCAICMFCGRAFVLPENDDDGNLPRVLLCGHVYCTNCLLCMQSDNVIWCPDCEVESTLPENGVFGLQEESRIIGLIYTAKMNETKRRKNRLALLGLSNSNPESVEQVCSPVEQGDQLQLSPSQDKSEEKQMIEGMVDQALAQAAANLSQLENTHKTLTDSLTKQMEKLEMEIAHAVNKAVSAVRKWKDVQLRQLKKQDSQLFPCMSVASQIQEKMKTLENAMKMAREVRRVPRLEQYCVLDKLIETLNAPLEFHDIKSSLFDPEISLLKRGVFCCFQTRSKEESLDQTLSLTLKMTIMSPKPPPESPAMDPPMDRCSKKSATKWIKKENSSVNSVPDVQKEDDVSLVPSLSPLDSPPTPNITDTPSLPEQSTSPEIKIENPDVIIEEVLDDEPKPVNPPTGPDLARKKPKLPSRRSNMFFNKQSVPILVVVTHIVSPVHFYVSYVADEKENEIVSKKIHQHCSRSECYFTPEDSIETRTLVFAKSKEKQWCRCKVIEIFQRGSAESVTTCPVRDLARVRIFFIDYGFCHNIKMESEGMPEASLKAVNDHLRKATEDVTLELSNFPPQAIRCSLKDLVPYDGAKGWDSEARAVFRNITGSAALEMQPLSQDRDTLLVDLKKTSVGQYSDIPVSVREYLVFNEVARYYFQGTPNRKPLLYYPPVCPQVNVEHIAVVCHINSPSDFYIQLVNNMDSLVLSANLQNCYNTKPGFEGDELKVYCPELGQPCVAPFEGNTWYRAQVIGNPRVREVEVLYVDYGNKKVLPVSDLRKIKEEFFALPAMALHCSLSGLAPPSGKFWSKACTDRFISLTYQQLVTVVYPGKVSRSEPLAIKVFRGDLKGPRDNVAEMLVKEELAYFKDSPTHRQKYKKPSPQEDDPVVWDPQLEELCPPEARVASPARAALTEQKQELLDLQALLKLHDQLKDLTVRVSHVRSPSSFYVQLTQYDSQLIRINERLKQECAQTAPQDVTWKADMYCAAHVNGVWERGQIRANVTSSDIAEVIRCDHGSTVKLHVSNLRLLPPALSGSLSLECTLYDIRPAGGRSAWSGTASDLFSLYLTGVLAVMNIMELTDERPVPVTLFCPNKVKQCVSIADFLVVEGLALRKRKPSRSVVIQEPKEKDKCLPAGSEADDKETSSPQTSECPEPLNSLPPSHPPKPSPRLIMSAEKVKTSLYDPPELPSPGNIQMTISAVGEDGVIYARTKASEHLLEQLNEKIQQSWNTLPRPKMYTWRSVQGCAVIGSDMLWYRGQILSVLGGNVEVQYVDHGFVENIPVAHVHPILLHPEVPQLCVPCLLHGLNPVGGKWQQYAVALMREMLHNRQVDVRILEVPADPRGALSVEIFLDGLSFGEILCHHEHATIDTSITVPKEPAEISPKPILDEWKIDTQGLLEPEEPVPTSFLYPNLPQEGEHFKVRVKHLWTPNELFLWPLEGTPAVEVDGLTLDDALGKINENVGSLLPLTSFTSGSPCLAEYSDGKFYRARLMKINSLDPVTILVQHVDFGSDDIVPTSKLRQMPAGLMKFPTQVLKVKVSGFKAPSDTRHEDLIPYSPRWSLAAAMEMLELLHGSITAVIVAREPELTVELFDEDGELVHLGLVSKGLAELE